MNLKNLNSAVKRLLKHLLIGLIALSAVGTAQAIGIKKSSHDERLYQYLTLNNGLEVLLVSDKDTVKSAAVMNVKVGSFDDPSDVPGMAHFAEHMLFLGTAKYPDPGEYSSFINLHNGSANAFTSSETTGYFFNIDNNHFTGALDRFSQFFISPQFNANLVSRELNAINAEHSLNLGSDIRKIHEASKIIFKQSFPASRFSTGNSNTLSNIPNLRKRLIDFYQSYYSSDTMKLVLLGKEPLAKLEAYAKKYFGNIPRRTVKSRDWHNQKVFNESAFGSLLKIKTIQDKKKLDFEFFLPPLREFYQEKPASYIASLVGEESKGSLLDILKQKGLADSLSAGAYNSTSYSIFHVTIGLTDEGSNNIELISQLLFGYLKHIKEREPRKWRFLELGKIAKIGFENKPKEDPASYAISLARRMHYYPTTEILTAPYSYQKYAPGLIKKVLEKLVPENMLIVYSGVDVVGTKLEKWYQTPYELQKYPKSQIGKFKQLPERQKKDFKLPEANKFLPKQINQNVTLHATEQPQKPALLFSNDRIDFWFFNEQKIDRQNATIKISFQSPLASKTVENSLMNDLIAKTWLEQINPQLYPARLVGLSYGITASYRGWEMTISGLKEGIYNVLVEMLRDLEKSSLPAKIFAIKKDRLQKNIANIKFKPPLDRGFLELSFIRKTPAIYHLAQENALPNINLQQANRFKKELLAKGKVVAYLHGNFSENKAREFVDLILSELNYQAVLESEITENKISNLKAGINTLVLPSINNDSAVITLFQSDRRNLKETATSVMLSRFIDEPFYTQIRTTEQLGYVVSASGYADRRVSYLGFIVQSPNKSPSQINERLFNFIKNHTARLLKITDHQWQTTKQSVIDEFAEYPKTIEKLAGQWWHDISQKNWDFKRNLIVIPYLESLSRKDMLDFWQRIIFSAKKKQLNIWISGKQYPLPAIAETELITDITKFKSGLTTFSQYPNSN